MNVTELKEKLLTSLDLWADARISDMVKETPALAIPSVYMKRASHNIIAKNKDKWGKSIDNATLFIADEDGNIDANTIFEDMMQMLKSVEDYKFDVGLFTDISTKELCLLTCQMGLPLLSSLEAREASTSQRRTL